MQIRQRPTDIDLEIYPFDGTLSEVRSSWAFLLPRRNRTLGPFRSEPSWQATNERPGIAAGTMVEGRLHVQQPSLGCLAILITPPQFKLTWLATMLFIPKCESQSVENSVIILACGPNVARGLLDSVHHSVPIRVVEFVADQS